MADSDFADNPWSPQFWNLTKQGAYIKKYGVEVAKTKAKQAGTKLGAAPAVMPNPQYMPLPTSRNGHHMTAGRKFTVIIQQKGGAAASGGGGGGGGGLIGAGSSGTGPPE